MTISATTQGLRMGVATSSSRPTVPFDGQVISETDTDSLQVYKGSAWAPVSGLTLIKAQTIGSGVSSVTVTDAFSATYDNYLITISGGVSSANVNIGMILGATTSGYAYNNIYMAYSSATVNGEQSNGVAASWIRVGRTSTNSLDGEIVLKLPFETKRTTANWRTSTSIAGELWSIGGGYLDNATSYTAFTLTPSSSATLTGGTICVYGYAKA
jgi:hypothetical protein